MSFLEWLDGTKDVKCWEFWDPRSGIIGGFIAGMLLFELIGLVFSP